MQTVKTNSLTIPAYMSLAFFVALACLGLAYLDKDTKSLSDLIHPGNLIALMIYFIPTYLVSGLFYFYAFKKAETGKKLFYALLAGIPLGFTMVILFFVIWGSVHAAAM